MCTCSRSLIHMTWLENVVHFALRFFSEQQIIDCFLHLAEKLAQSTENALDDELVAVLRKVLSKQVDQVSSVKQE